MNGIDEIMNECPFETVGKCECGGDIITLSDNRQVCATCTAAEIKSNEAQNWSRWKTGIGEKGNIWSWDDLIIANDRHKGLVTKLAGIAQGYTRASNTIFGLICYGNRDTGKSTHMELLRRSMVDHGHSCIYIEEKRLPDIYFNNHDYYTKDKLIDCDMLIIEEAGTGSDNENIVSHQIALMSERHKLRRITILITNFDPKDPNGVLAKRYDYDMLRRYGLVKFDFSGHRGYMW